jgi:long-subunit acyl-CoA synthetase (AMP-forming)
MPRDVMDRRPVDAAGKTVPKGEEDALLVRTKGHAPRKGFFSGYLGDAVATEQAWDGSWFHTGDILSADENGRLYLP